MKTLSIVFVLALCLIFANCAPTIEYAQRKVNAATQFVEDQIIYNIANNDNSPLSSVDLVFPSNNLYFTAFSEYSTIESDKQSKNKDKQYKILKTTTETHNNLEYTIFTVQLDKELAKGDSVKVVSVGIYGHVQKALPEKITQEGVQLMRLQGNHYVASVYPIVAQSTEFKAEAIVGHSDEPPSKPSESSVLYGPYENLGPWSFSKLSVHYVNQSPFLTITNMRKTIEVSHWGANVAIEQNIKLENQGALLDGTFSRLDYMMGKRGNSVNEIIEHLPKGANSAYYRDVIGNISSSHIFPHKNTVKYELTPRFVLFGGWKTEYLIGFNLPAETYIKADSNTYKLAVPFVHDIENTIIDEIDFEIILPEGATDVKINSPYPIGTPKETNKKTYLDTTGRTVVTFTARNILPSAMTKNLEVTYQFSGSSLLFEPLYLIGGYFSLFLLAIFFFRFNLEISSVVPDHASEIDPELQALKHSIQADFEKVKHNYGNKKTFGSSVNDLSKALESAANRFSAKGHNDTAAALRDVKKNLSRVQSKNKEADEKTLEDIANSLSTL